MDRFTEGMLNRLDKDVKKKFGVSVHAVIKDPSAFIGEDGFAVKLSKITDYIDSETARMIEQSKGAGRAFHESAAKTDDLTRKIGSYVSLHSFQNNIPFIKLANVELPVEGQSRFYLNKMDDLTSKFIERLIVSSSFIVDMTREYDGIKLGSWLFGGEKQYVVSVHAPKNSLLLLRSARAEMLERLAEASDSIKGL